MSQGYSEFEFDLPEALLAKLIEEFAAISAAPLTDENLKTIPESQGVYQLFFGKTLVYIGKTDAEAGLKKRLIRHLSKIQHRVNLNPQDVSFKAIRVFVFTAVDLETQLIKHYDAITPVEWNSSGFGANDPGRQRDTTNYRDGHFDLLYPIDIDRPLSLTLPEKASAAEVLNVLKYALPYTFRFESAPGSSRKPHPELLGAVVIAGKNPVTAKSLLAEVVGQLGAGWQATKLPSTLILYKERKEYAQGEIIARSSL